MTSPVAEGDEVQPSSSTTDGQTGGYTLQGRPASVTLGRKESLTRKVNASDHLEGTKDFVSHLEQAYFQ